MLLPLLARDPLPKGVGYHPRIDGRCASRASQTPLLPSVRGIQWWVSKNALPPPILVAWLLIPGMPRFLPQMRHLATYMLLVLGGNAAPTKADVTTALAAVGVDVSSPSKLVVMVLLLWFRSLLV